jgi:hypothetical protein
VPVFFCYIHHHGMISPGGEDGADAPGCPLGAVGSSLIDSALERRRDRSLDVARLRSPRTCAKQRPLKQTGWCAEHQKIQVPFASLTAPAVPGHNETGHQSQKQKIRLMGECAPLRCALRPSALTPSGHVDARACGAGASLPGLSAGAPVRRKARRTPAEAGPPKHASCGVFAFARRASALRFAAR